MLRRSGMVHSTKKFRHLIASHAPTEQRFLHIFKERNGAYVSVRQRIESFESGSRGAFVSLPADIGRSTDPIFADLNIKAF